MSSSENICRIPPQNYIHVLNKNTNITHLEIGPMIFVAKDHESIIKGPVNHLYLQPK